MITSKEKLSLEARAARLGLLEAMALFRHKETGKPLWLCKVWAQFIRIKNAARG